jgi:hypothetical protein
MRLPRARITVRRLMTAMVAVAVIIWGFLLWKRADFYRWKARYHDRMQRASLIAVVDGPREAGPAELASLGRQWVAYHAALREKYEDAARRPWASIPPDPPTPVPLSEGDRRVDLNFGP